MTFIFLAQVRRDCARPATPTGDHPGAVGHGQGASRHVLQVHRRIQAAQDHHLQGRSQRGTVLTRPPARTDGHSRGLHQGTRNWKVFKNCF